MEKNNDNTEHIQYADVILPLAVPLLYTYEIPKNLISQITVGSRVIVQLGNRKMYTAIVYSIHSKKPEKYATKPIDSILDATPIVNKLQIQFWDWISEYYMCTRGEVMKAALPAGLKLESEAIVYCNPDFTDLESLTDSEALAYSAISENNAITITELAKILLKKSATQLVHTMLQKKIIITGETFTRTFKPKTECRLQLQGSAQSQDFVNSAFAVVSKAPKQQELFLAFLDLHLKSKNEKFSISRKELLEKIGTSAQIITELIKKGILLEFDQTVSRLETTEQELNKEKSLSKAQEIALTRISKSFETQNVCLLHGITASGKTEIYIHLIQQIISQGKQVLYLLPEIALTSQIIMRLRKVFGNKVGVYHSKFSDNERVEVWNNLIANNENTYSIILGVRSSVFLPFSNLGLIIIDEEHETSFKQYDPAPRYNARDSAIVLSQIHNAKTLLGTATPSIETYYNVLQNKYALVELTERHSQVALPEIKIIDLVKARKQKRIHSTIFSKDLLEKIDSVLLEKQQIILFQNRRGFAPLIECTDCGHIPHCKHCDVSLTLHKFSNTLICHYCGYTVKHIHTCIACGSSKVESLGFGTEQIQDELKELYPTKKIARMDLDTTRGKHAYADLIEDFENREIDILIGTQMITKGLDFDNVGLVGILHADSILNIPDFRAFERGFQMMVQVAGRAGRSTKRGEVYIQTFTPEHTIITQIKNHDYMSMMNAQMADRSAFKYPPFVKLIRITIKHKDKSKTIDAAQIIASHLRSIFQDNVLGPEFPPIPRIQTWYMQDILLKIPKTISLEKAKKQITTVVQTVFSEDTYKGVQWFANVDPY